MGLFREENADSRLQDMIAAYKAVKGKACAKCRKTLNDNMAKPIARRSKQVPSVNETTQTVWEPFHENCI